MLDCRKSAAEALSELRKEFRTPAKERALRIKYATTGDLEARKEAEKLGRARGLKLIIFFDDNGEDHERDGDRKGQADGITN